MSILWVVARDYIAQLLTRRRSAALAGLCLAPALLEILFRWLEPPGVPERLAGPWRNFVWLNGSSFLLQGIGVWIVFSLAPSIVSEEAWEGSLTYALVRPVSKGRIFLARYLGCAASVAMVLAAGQIALSLAAFAGTDMLGTIARPMGPLGRILAVQAMACFLYAGAGALLALVTTRPTVWGLAYFFFGELVLAGQPHLLSRFTLLHYLRSLVIRAVGDVPALLQTDMLLPLVSPHLAASEPRALLVVLTAGAAFAVLAAVQFSRREWAPDRAQ